MKRIARLIVLASSRLAPRHLRAEWQEEWLAELDVAGSVSLSRIVAAPWDALTLRWTTRVTSPRSNAWRSAWSSDLRQTARFLVHSPGHVALVVGCLAVGLAASVAIFSIVNSLLYGEQAGLRDRRSLLRIFVSHDEATGTEGLGRRGVVSASPLTRLDYDVLRAHGPALSGIAAEGDINMAAMTAAGPVGVTGALVSGNYFEILGTRPLRGRLLGPADDQPGAPPVVVVGEHFWQVHLGGRADVVGQPLLVGGRALTIVGVAEPRFTGIQPVAVGEPVSEGLQLWLPLVHASSWPGAPAADRVWLSTFGRLAPGATRAEAESQLALGAARLEAAYPSTRRRAAVVVRPHGFGPGDSPTDVLLIIVMFLSVPIAVLAIACANIANVQLARATERAHELAVRLALGGTRLQLIRLLTIESLVLTLAAAVAGTIAAVVALRLSAGFFPLAIPLDWRVLAFAVTLAAAVTMFTGIVPAWLIVRRAMAINLADTARAGGHVHARLRGALVVIQVALSVVLLFIGALFTRSLQALNAGIPDDARKIIRLELDLEQQAGYGPAETRRLIDEALARFNADSRVQASAFVDFTLVNEGIRYTAPGEDVERASTGGYATPGWFAVADAHVLAGRVLTDDDAGKPVAVVNESLARRLTDRSAGALGMTLKVRRPWVTSGANRLAVHRGGSSDVALVQIVGIIGNVLPTPDGRTLPAIYLPMPALPPTSLALLVRTENATAVMADAGKIMSAVDSRLPFLDVRTIAQRIQRAMDSIRYVALSVGGFGSLALALAMVGLYGVLAYVVSLRRREFGVRLAMGARSSDLMRLVVRQSLRFVAIGAALGFAVAVPFALLIRAALIGISPVDPLAMLPTVAALLAMGLLGAIVPARRAARVDPVSALREN